MSKEQLGRILTTITLLAGFTQVDAKLLPSAEVLSSCVDAFLVTWGILVAVALQAWGYVRRYKKGDVTPLGGYKKS